MSAEPMTIGSLFSGIGGLEMGVEHATGGHVVWQVESNPFCRAVLAKHWPDAVRHDDVRTVGAELGCVDTFVGGFPCQDLSLAGKRAGFAGERSSLWREYRRLVDLLRPEFVLVENVPPLTTSRGGWDFAEVLGDLASLGYDATWDRFRGSDVGAPHRRERIFVLAYADGGQPEQPQRQPERGDAAIARAAREAVADAEGERHETRRLSIGASAQHARADVCGGDAMADADVSRLEVGQGLCRDPREEHTTAERSGDGRDAAVAYADRVAEREPQHEAVSVARSGRARAGSRGRSGRITLAGVGRGDDGLPRGLDAHRWPAGRGEAQHEWEPPRTEARVAQRKERLMALGNAVIPQVAALAWRVLYARIMVAA